MRLALFVGCTIPARVPAYETAARAVLRAVDVELVDLDFACCGYPARHLQRDAHLVLAARNLALAAARGLDVLTLCQCCYGSLRHAQALLRRHADARAVVARDLGPAAPDPAAPAVRHLLDLLDRDVGAAAIAARVTRPQRHLTTAAHYGCHALRPSDVVDLDNPHAPTIFERLLEAAGAQVVDWPRRLECCGAPLAHTNPVLAARLRRSKLADAREAGAAYLCTACPFCQEQLAGALPTLLFPQILGLALGLSPRAVGLRAAPGEPAG